MKKIILSILIIAVFIAASCGSKKGKTNTPESPSLKKEKTNTPEIPSLNISIFIDLSDRLVRDMTPCQMYRDTAIVNFLADYFKQKTLGPAITRSQNKIKVFCYPSPQDSEISVLMKGLSVDVGEKEGREKRKCLEEMKTVFQQNLGQIYNETIGEKNWVGCDIWDFFQSKKVDNLCVKKNSRNIVVILTDGYIFYEKNKIKNGNAYSYIVPQTLSVKGSSLIDNRNSELKGKGIEVLFLEVNPYHPQHRDKMMKILEDWFESMGVEKFAIAETDADLTNTQTLIKNFLDNN